MSYIPTIGIAINDQQVQIALRNFNQRLNPQPILKIIGQIMRSSIVRTFQDQGSPPGSWRPLSPATLKRGKGGLGRKTLIQSGRLRNSVTDNAAYVISGNVLRIGSNLIYARIQQEGGLAGRGRKVRIPARPFLVVRPEDPGKIKAAIERYVQTGAK
ncbi:MAG TPA: phage virion morphogenesis protein [Candidatus Angelobacter sp.]|nr:phage virion morphogenesis protein [Candidatus Angelobacter sp.]